MGVSIWEGNKAQALIDAIQRSDKVDKQQGVINAGKSLVIGDDGIVGVGTTGLSENAKLALINAFNNVAWANEHGAEFVKVLQDSLYIDSVESWDYEWNYLQGLPENHGMSIVDGATGQTISMTAEGTKIETEDTTSSILRYSKPVSPIERNTLTLEVIFSCEKWGTYNNYPYMNGIRITAGFGVLNNDYIPGTQLSLNQSGVSYYSPGIDTGDGNSNHLLDPTPIELNTIYKCRIEMENTTSGGVKSTEANVFLNGRFLGRVINKGENIGGSQFIVKHGATGIFKAFRLKQN